ncbi:hypothetical protein Sjap_000688 [Stephania japonica]|uniref:Uncharacterized protein n=1 Tax=Stephania japonica TaxID=461633 RepID=A0AAP0KIK4_9MAGN
MVRKPTKSTHVSLEIFEHYKMMRSTPEYKRKSAQASLNWRSEEGEPSSGPFVHGGGSISIYEHSLRLEKKLHWIYACISTRRIMMVSLS